MHQQVAKFVGDREALPHDWMLPVNSDYDAVVLTD